MECSICGKVTGTKLPITCTVCARATIYSLRVEQTRTLIEKEYLAKQVNALVNLSQNEQDQHISLDGALVDMRECAKRIDLERVVNSTNESENRAAAINEQAEFLRRKIEERRKEVEDKRTMIARRRSDLASATHDIEVRRANELEKTKRMIKRVTQKWESIHGDTVHARAYLCREAAILAGLKRRPGADDIDNAEYTIGGLRIYDLRHLNVARPAQLSASLSILAQLVVRVANYLSVRLPAEITLHHRGCPLPTIFPPASSYLHRDIPNPGSSPHSSNNSPTASRTLDQQKSAPRPRPLRVDKELPKLAQEDPVAYSLFVEGVTFLAWDIAWLCRTQGMRSEFNRWEDVCSLGKNLWQLLAAPRQAPTVDRKASLNTAALSSSSKDQRATRLKSPTKVSLGVLSHGASHSSLTAAPAMDEIGRWKFHSPTKVVDKVKASLVAEMQGAEWELLDGREWDMGRSIAEEEPVDLGARDVRAEHGDAKKMSSSRAASLGEVKELRLSMKMAPKIRGTKGWTKLKSPNE